MHLKKKKIITVVVVLAVVIWGSGVLFKMTHADRLKEISGEYTGIDLREDGTEILMSDEDDSECDDYNSCYGLSINSEKIPYLDVWDMEAENPGMAGWIIGLSDSTITLWLNPLETDFGFGPFDGNWFVPVYKLKYEMIQDKLILSHGEAQTPFRKD